MAEKNSEHRHAGLSLKDQGISIKIKVINENYNMTTINQKKARHIEQRLSNLLEISFYSFKKYGTVNNTENCTICYPENGP